MHGDDWVYLGRFHILEIHADFRSYPIAKSQVGCSDLSRAEEIKLRVACVGLHTRLKRVFFLNGRDWGGKVSELVDGLQLPTGMHGRPATMARTR